MKKSKIYFIGLLVLLLSFNTKAQDANKMKIITKVAPMKMVLAQQQEYTVVVKVTGVRGKIHNGDCQRIDGTIGLVVKPDTQCSASIKPFSGKPQFTGLRDGNQGWRHQWTQKKIAKYEKLDTSPRNHSYTAVYKVKAHDLQADGFGLHVKGFAQGCHKKDDFSPYDCAVVYHIDRKLSLENSASTKQYTVGSTSPDDHNLKFYIEVTIK